MLDQGRQTYANKFPDYFPATDWWIFQYFKTTDWTISQFFSDDWMTIFATFSSSNRLPNFYWVANFMGFFFSCDSLVKFVGRRVIQSIDYFHGIFLQSIDKFHVFISHEQFMIFWIFPHCWSLQVFFCRAIDGWISQFFFSVTNWQISRFLSYELLNNFVTLPLDRITSLRFISRSQQTYFESFFSLDWKKK